MDTSVWHDKSLEAVKGRGLFKIDTAEFFAIQKVDVLGSSMIDKQFSTLDKWCQIIYCGDIDMSDCYFVDERIAEDTHEYLDEKGNPIERTGLFFKIFFHLNEYVGKLTNAELDNMNDEKIIQLTTDLQVMMIHLNKMQKKLKETTEETTESGFLMKFESGRNSEGEGQMRLELKGDTEPGAQMRFEPRTSENQNNPASNQQRKPSGQENRMSKYLLKSMLITLDLAFTKVVIESCLRGLPYNSNFRKASELRERLLQGNRQEE